MRPSLIGHSRPPPGPDFRGWWVITLLGVIVLLGLVGLAVLVGVQ